ncbi:MULTISPECIES: hypothetical protein [Chitinophagaceae]|uniref:hypothetical protein n=1 Tax=Chitinophagaceae TaxID=563835 RepID=UPI000DF01A2C|nr:MULTISPECIES: hypothetical protein [Chitinophagaceae]RPD51761.1 hypothetical protein DRJ53_03520 [Paracnuella aquatica]
MKSIYKKLFLLAPLVLLLFVQASAGVAKSKKASSKARLFAPIERVHFPKAIGPHSLIEELEEHEVKWVHATFERKKKSRFVVRNACASQYLRKGLSRGFTLNNHESATDPDHEPAPDEIWHAKPRYYVFLFRLCPF